MIDENLKTFMEKVEIKNKDIAIYKNDEKGIMYPLGLSSLLTRVDYLELTKEELSKAQFEQKVDKGEYEMFDCDKLVSKYEITKIEADRFTMTNKKVKATHIWNVSNAVGIHQTFTNKEDAFKLSSEINNKIVENLK
jgi:hypothetical protein